MRDAAFTGSIALGLFLPLIGFLTGVNGSNQLILTTRWPLLFGFVVVIAACRFLYCFARASQPARQSAPPAPATGLPQRLRGHFARWGIPAAIGFAIAYPVHRLCDGGRERRPEWIDNFGIQILIYVMLGWGLNIVVGLAGLLDLGYVAFYAVGAYSYALLAKTFGLTFWLCCRLPASCPRSGASCSVSRCCGCAATISPSSRSPSAKSSASS